MNNSILNDLKKNPRSSFAKWKVNPKNPKDVSDLSVYNNIKLTDLKPNIIFVGMNLADNSTANRSLSNYHSTNTKHNDYRLAESLCDQSLNKTFEWSYMYDLFNDEVSKSKDIEEKYKNDTYSRNKQINEFINHCRYINQSCNESRFEVQKTTKYIICIGKGYHYKALKKYFKDNKQRLTDFELCGSILHHSNANNHWYCKAKQIELLNSIKKTYNL